MTKRTNAEKKVVLLCGGGSGCVTNIICDRLMKKSDEYFLIVAGRTPMKDRDGVPVNFIHFDLFEENACGNLIRNVGKLLSEARDGEDDGVVPNKVTAIINSISTGGKVSYDTSMIAFLNYVSVNAMVYLAETLGSSLIHMSSMKVGQPDDFNPKVLEKKKGEASSVNVNNESNAVVWKGARSPYAWSKLAAELKLVSSDLKDMSFVRIGLVDSRHAVKFYTRVRMVCDFPVTVTEERDLQDSIEEAIHKKGRHVTTVKSHVESNYAFYRRMSNRILLFQIPVWLFNFIFGSLMPTKMMDYIHPSCSTTYKLPF